MTLPTPGTITDIALLIWAAGLWVASACAMRHAIARGLIRGRLARAHHHRAGPCRDPVRAGDDRRAVDRRQHPQPSGPEARMTTLDAIGHLLPWAILWWGAAYAICDAMDRNNDPDHDGLKMGAVTVLLVPVLLVLIAWLGARAFIKSRRRRR